MCAPRIKSNFSHYRAFTGNFIKPLGNLDFTFKQLPETLLLSYTS